MPTVAGVLLIGSEPAIARHVPAHEVAFQVLDGTTDVRVNEFYRGPLVRIFERLEEHFGAHNREDEVQVGLFRVPVPLVEPRAFRECVVNALTHRDYARLGAVHVRWERETLTVSNPGGFVDGVTLDNLLVVEPRPRNRQLADAIKRVGLAERTGRGIDLIYSGLLRYGRPRPDYSRSDAYQVVVSLSCAEADRVFLEIVLAEEKRTGVPLPLNSLIALSLLNAHRRIDTPTLAGAIQKPNQAARGILERLTESGLARAHGTKRGRTYTLSPELYRRMGNKYGYVHQAGFDALQQEQMVKNYANVHGAVRRRDVVALCRLSGPQATRMLKRLVEQGALIRRARGRTTHYEPRSDP